MSSPAQQTSSGPDSRIATIAARACRSMRGMLALLLVSLLPQGARSSPSEFPTPAESFNLRNWTTTHGLPHNVASAIKQDKAGYLWIASLGGLSRFDGRAFRTFPVPEPETSGGRNVRDLAILPDGSVLLIHAAKGLMQLQNGSFVAHPLSAYVADKNPIQLFVEPGGVIWLTCAEGLLRWEGGSLERLPLRPGTDYQTTFSWAMDRLHRTWIAGPGFCAYYSEGRLVDGPLPVSGSCSLAVSASGGLWILAGDLFAFDGAVLTKVADLETPPDGQPFRSMFEDHTGRLWIASSGQGLYYLHGDHIVPVANLGTSVRSLSEDAEGNIWLGTYGAGIAMLRRKPFTQIPFRAMSVNEDNAGSLWFAGGAAGIARHAPGSATVQVFPVEPESHVVTTVCATLSDTLWVGTTAGVLRSSIHDPSTLHDTGIAGQPHVVFRTVKGDVWFAGTGILGYFRGLSFNAVSSPLPPNEEVLCFAEDSTGQLWLGSTNGSLLGFDSGQLTRSRLMPNPLGARINAIAPDGDGTLWIATNDGLLRLAGSEVKRLSKNEGLPDNLVLQVVADRADHLWLTSPTELYRIAKSELVSVASGRKDRLEAISFTSDHGLTGISPRTSYGPSAIRDATGRLWFCVYGETVNLSPSDMVVARSPVPLLLEELHVDDRISTASDGMFIVPAGSQRLEFRFAAPSYMAPDRVLIRHRLEGFDAEWVSTPPDHRARYAKLPPGDYRLRVTACNADGVWNDQELTLAVSVTPLFWQRRSVQVAALLVFALILTLGVRAWTHRRLMIRIAALEQEKAIELERARIARDMHDELGGSLTGINLLVQRMLDHTGPGEHGVLAQLDRRVHRLIVELERVVWTVSPKNRSLDRLGGFIEQFVTNLVSDSGTKCTVTGGNEMPAVGVTPEAQHHILAAIKEAVSNSLKHARASEITVTLIYDEGVLNVRISDNGVGFDVDAREHSERNGLTNIRSRMSEIGGQAAIESQIGSGTTIQVTLPVAPPSRKR